MSDIEKPEPAQAESGAPAQGTAAARFGEILSQANLTTGLAVLAVILAGAPYVWPKIASLQVEKGLMHKPAMLMDASRKLQAEEIRSAEMKTTEQIKAHHESIFNDKADPVLGSGPIKLVAFLDYQCAYCRAGEPAVQAFLKDNPDVQLIVKEYPVVHPPVSVQMAQIAMAASQAGKYAAVHDALLTKTLKSDADLDALLMASGLDPQTVRKAAISQPIRDHVSKTVTLGENLNITGTPTFIIGDQAITGTNIGALQAAVDAARARANGK